MKKITFKSVLILTLIAFIFSVVSMPAFANDGSGEDNQIRNQRNGDGKNSSEQIEMRNEGRGFFKNFGHGFFFGHFRNQKSDSKDERKNDTKDEGQKNHRLNMGVAIVTERSGNEITARNAWGNKALLWTINVDSDTSYKTRTGATSTLSDVDVGDTITFKGTFENREADYITLTASDIRIWGDVDLESRVTATGTITSIDEDDQELTIMTEDGKSYTINSTNLTIIKDEDGNREDFNSLETGFSVKIRGFFNSLKDAITAIKIKIL